MDFYATIPDVDGDAAQSEHMFSNSHWLLQDTPPYETYDDLYNRDDWDVSQQQIPVDPCNLPQQSTEMSPTMMASKVEQSLGSSPPGPSNLSDSQRQKLQNIAMPTHLPYHSPTSEPSPPESFAGKCASVSSPDGQQSDSSKSGGHKRKSPAEDDDDELDEHPVKKTAHNQIEKRYRTNLNDKIAALRDSVPSLRIMTKSARGEDTTEDREELHGLTPAHKLNKATVLSKATEYIRHLEKRNTRLQDEVSAMQARIAAFEKLFMAGAMNSNMSPIRQQQSPIIGQYDPNGFDHSAVRPDAPGMDQVPEDMKHMFAAPISQPSYSVPQQQSYRSPALVRQQQIQQQQQQVPAGRWQNASSFFPKMMVGSLATMMVLEAIHETEQSNETPAGRGLFAMPTQLISRFISSMDVNLMGYHAAASEVLFSLKMVLLLGSLFWIFYPSFARMSPDAKTSKQAQASPEAAPSLASPIHVRRQAWLTAVQTVWVPRHNFFLEVAALGLKAFKLSLRNSIGIPGYQMLTGLTEEQEMARVKAWTIALDAQLAGGDVEVSKSRLTLTYLASNTLPDTPLRLMLKALHIRVLLWEVGLKGISLNMLASKLARAQWKQARELHLLLTRLRRGGQDPSDEELPHHLAVLLQQECDDVLNASVVQRVHNLAWNRPTHHNATGVRDGMDLVVDDNAVRSPMDAVAAWFSTSTLHAALANSLLMADDHVLQSVEDAISLAIRTAPIGSVAQNRALVGRAVLFNEKRGANIAAVIQAIGPVTASSAADDVSEWSASAEATTPHVPASSSTITEEEISIGLQCAKAIAHLQRYAPPEEPTNVYSIIHHEVHVHSQMSLLGYTAAFTLMERLANHEFAADACSSALERLSGSLRIWISRDSLLDSDVKQEMVERCLAVTRGVVGMDMENDTGYDSMGSDDGRCQHDEACDSPVCRTSPSLECH